MNITELIAQLETLREIHGDLPVYAGHDYEEIKIDKAGFHDYEKYIYILPLDAC